MKTHQQYRQGSQIEPDDDPSRTGGRGELPLVRWELLVHHRTSVEPSAHTLAGIQRRIFRNRSSWLAERHRTCGQSLQHEGFTWLSVLLHKFLLNSRLFSSVGASSLLNRRAIDKIPVNTNKITWEKFLSPSFDATTIVLDDSAAQPARQASQDWRHGNNSAAAIRLVTLQTSEKLRSRKLCKSRRDFFVRFDLLEIQKLNFR